MSESKDEWGRQKLAPCPFCGAKGFQLNGREFVTFEHTDTCWILDKQRAYGNITYVSESDQFWNVRPKNSGNNP